VAERAGVTERTVYRYFPSERELRDAVLERLETEAGVDIDDLRLEDLRDMTTRIFEYVSSFPLEQRTVRDPTMAAANERQRAALVSAVGPATEGWADDDRAIAAAMLDVMWSVVSYERLVADWDLDPKHAISGITWVMGLIEQALAEGQRPSG
jgi:AcrR family transcriptional regulator